MTAFGGGGVVGNGIVYTKGLAKSGSGSVNNAYYMVGNMGEALRKVFSMTSSVDFQETEYAGDGGAPVGLLNANPITGVVSFSFNNGPASYLIIPNSVKMPSAGGPSYYGGVNFSGGDGMVIIWYN